MGNLTQQTGIVKPGVAPAPLAGYKVVVFEKLNGGKLFRTILNPGDQPLKKKSHIFSSIKNYYCCAISSDTNLNFDLETDVILAEQQQKFSLKCTIYYYVTSPERMARIYDKDPVALIREEIQKKLKLNILRSKADIQNIQENFYGLKNEILPNHTLNGFRKFAGEYGVMIKDINMTYVLPERYLQPGIRKDNFRLKEETGYITEIEKRRKHEEDKEKMWNKQDLRRIEYKNSIEDKEHEHQLKNMDNDQSAKNKHHEIEMGELQYGQDFKKQMADQFIRAVGQTVSGIDSPESLTKAVDAGIEVIKKIGNEVQNPEANSSAQPINSGGNHFDAISPEESGPHVEIIAILNNILSKLKNLSASFEKKDRETVYSSITTLISEIKLQQGGNKDIIKISLDRLATYLRKYKKILTHAEFTAFKRLKELIIEIFPDLKNDDE